jgi:hypothetical protein
VVARRLIDVDIGQTQLPYQGAVMVIAFVIEVSDAHNCKGAYRKQLGRWPPNLMYPCQLLKIATAPGGSHSQKATGPWKRNGGHVLT